MSMRRPVWSRLQKYWAGTSLRQLQKLHWKRRPPSAKMTCGLMYALQRRQRMGPSGPWSTTATGLLLTPVSPSGWIAKHSGI